MLDNFAVLLVNDHPLFRDGLAMALHQQAPGMRVQAVATLAEALTALATADQAGEAIDLVLLDYLLPGMDGLRCAELLMSRHPHVGVGLISGLDEPTLPHRARQAGLIAYLPKSLEIPVLLQHLRRLARGEPVFSAPGPPLPPGGAARLDSLGLTVRQLDVLRALAGGGSNKEIARAIGTSPATAKKHLEAIFKKLGASSRLQAAMLARSLLHEPPS